MDCNPKQSDLTLKVLIIGDYFTGKTCIVNRYIKDDYGELTQSTLGVEFGLKYTNDIINNKTLKLQIWDTAGMERFYCITQSFFRYSENLIVVYDVNNHKTFDNAKIWIEKYEDYNKYRFDHVNIILLGNKIDVDETYRQVSYEELKEYATKKNINFAEISAKTGENVKKAIDSFIVKVIINENRNKEEYKNKYNLRKNDEIIIDVDDKKHKYVKFNNCNCG